MQAVSRRIVAPILAMAALGGCASAGIVDGPPSPLRVDVATRISFVSDVEDICSAFGVRATMPGTNVVACTTMGGEMVVPNPCAWANWDGYARLLCHELGHVNGWSHNTPDVQERHFATALTPGSDGRVALAALAADQRGTQLAALELENEEPFPAAAEQPSSMVMASLDAGAVAADSQRGDEPANGATLVSPMLAALLDESVSEPGGLETTQARVAIASAADDMTETDQADRPASERLLFASATVQFAKPSASASPFAAKGAASQVLAAKPTAVASLEPPRLPGRSPLSPTPSPFDGPGPVLSISPTQALRGFGALRSILDTASEIPFALPPL